MKNSLHETKSANKIIWLSTCRPNIIFRLLEIKFNKKNILFKFAVLTENQSNEADNQLEKTNINDVLKIFLNCF